MERQAEEYPHGLLFLQIPRESGCTERETKVLSFSSKKPLIHGFFPSDLFATETGNARNAERFRQ